MPKANSPTVNLPKRAPASAKASAVSPAAPESTRRMRSDGVAAVMQDYAEPQA